MRDGVESFVEVDIEMQGGGLGVQERLEVVDVVVSLVVGARSELTRVEERVAGSKGREEVGKVGGEEFVDGVEEGNGAIVGR